MKKRILLKVVCGLCLIVVTLSIVGCGKDENKNKAQLKAVEVCEQYIDFDISKAEAKDKLNDIADRTENLCLRTDINYIAYLLCYPSVNISKFNEKYEYLKNHNYDLYDR